MRAASIALAALALAGCAPSIASAPADAGVTASARLALSDPAGRGVLEAVTPWTRADVHHARLTLMRGADDTVVMRLLVATPDLLKAVTFLNLKRHTGYRVVARAWADEAETRPIDNADVDAFTCTTAFTTGGGAHLDVGPLELRLRNKVFAGVGGTDGLSIIDGHVVDDPGPEAIAKP